MSTQSAGILSQMVPVGIDRGYGTTLIPFTDANTWSWTQPVYIRSKSTQSELLGEFRQEQLTM